MNARSPFQACLAPRSSVIGIPRCQVDDPVLARAAKGGTLIPTKPFIRWMPFCSSLDLVAWMEPAALLIQENLARIGVEAPLEKIPGANWRTAALVEKRLEMHMDGFGGWLNYPDYFFFWA